LEATFRYLTQENQFSHHFTIPRFSESLQADQGLLYAFMTLLACAVLKVHVPNACRIAVGQKQLHVLDLVERLTFSLDRHEVPVGHFTIKASQWLIDNFKEQVRTSNLRLDPRLPFVEQLLHNPELVNPGMALEYLVRMVLCFKLQRALLSSNNTTMGQVFRFLKESFAKDEPAKLQSSQPICFLPKARRSGESQ